MYDCKSLTKIIRKISANDLAMASPVFGSDLKKATESKKALLESLAETRQILEYPIKMKYVKAVIEAIGAPFDLEKYNKLMAGGQNITHGLKKKSFPDYNNKLAKFVERYFRAEGSNKYDEDTDHIPYPARLARILVHILGHPVDMNLVQEINKQIQIYYGWTPCLKFREICGEMEKSNPVYRDNWWCKELPIYRPDED
jgi:hypothetical protein